MSPKRARTGPPKNIPSGAKVPKVDRAVARGPDAGEHKVTFSFHYADHSYQGAWSWPTAEEAHDLLRFLCEIGNLRWNEVWAQTIDGHKKHHFQAVETLCREATDRIAQRHLTEVFDGDIFRFRVGNTERLWGFILAGVFYVLWWDAGHAVYPVKKG